MAQKNFADAMNQIVNGTNGLKTQINTKADKYSPALTGTPTAPTADNDTDSGQIATTEFCQNLIRRLCGVDTKTIALLADLADALLNQPDFRDAVVTVLGNKLDKTDAANTYLGKTATAAAASKVTGGTVQLTGSVTGSGTFNSAGNVSITTSGGGTTTTLYGYTGSSTTGGMTQKAITDALNNKADSSTVNSLQSTVNELPHFQTNWQNTSKNIYYEYTDKNGNLCKTTMGGNGASGLYIESFSDGSYKFYTLLAISPTQAEIKFREADSIISYTFKSDGIYLGSTKITN